MIPPAQIPSSVTGIPVSARDGFDPATGQPLASASGNAEAMAQEYDAETMRKINAATGKGFRRDAPVVEQESGEPITLKGPDGVPTPCKYCGVNPCRGQSWVFEGEMRFKCDACGRKQKLGYLEERSSQGKSILEGMELADYNRRRAWREGDAKAEEEQRRALDQIAQAPENEHISALRDRSFIDNAFFSS